MRPILVIDCYLVISTKLSLLSECSTRSLNRLRSVWYVIPLLLLGVLTSPKPPFQPTDDEKTRKNSEMRDRFHISAAILVRRRRPVASGIALDPLRRSMRLVTYRCTDRASETADKYGTFLHFFNGIRTRRPSGAIRPEYLPDGGVQRLRVKPWTPSIGRYRRCHAGASARASKRLGGGAFVHRRRSRDLPKRRWLT